MEKRAIIAAVLSMLVLLGYQYFFINPQMEARRKARRVEALKAKEAVAEKQAARPMAGPGKPQPDLILAPGAPLASKEVVVDTGVARIALTTLGAGVKEVTLLHYKDAKGKLLNLVREPDAKDKKASTARRWPLFLDGGGGFAEEANRSIYTADKETLTLSPRRPEGTVELVYRSPDGRAVSKAIRFRHGSYVFDVTLRWSGKLSSEDLAVVWGPGITTEGHEEDRYATTGPVTLRGGKLEIPSGGSFGCGRAEDVLKDGKPIVYTGKVQWTSLHSKYFMAAFIPRSEFNGAVIRSEGGVLVGLRYPGGSRGEAQFSVFAGPKDHAILKAADPSLEKAIDLGFFSFVAGPLLIGLRFFYKLTQSYGLSIIILTVLIKIIFYPLTQKSTKSMQQMQKLQPKMKQIREIFKDDKQRMNEEVMKLYKEHKVNPLGGCLPMLLQIPVFFALYAALLGAIELRQTPFLWVKDLSAPETGLFTIPGFDIEFRLLVLLMGASMFLQQKMTPAAGDPMQRKMMMFMPILFTFFFWSFPAGLVIYWLANNVLTIGQQYFTLRTPKVRGTLAPVKPEPVKQKPVNPKPANPRPAKPKAKGKAKARARASKPGKG